MEPKFKPGDRVWIKDLKENGVVIDAFPDYYSVEFGCGVNVRYANCTNGDLEKCISKGRE